MRSGEYVPARERRYCKTLFYKRRFIQEVIEALTAKNQKPTQLHDVFYGVRGKTSCHRDQRLTSPTTWRIIFCAPDPPGCPRTAKRLTFYLAQEAPPSGNWSRGSFTPHGAYCLGEMKTDVFMTGRGAGGVEVIPAGVVDLSGKWKDYPSSKWPPVYIFHEPFTKGGAEQKAGSKLAVSGTELVVHDDPLADAVDHTPGLDEAAGGKRKKKLASKAGGGYMTAGLQSGPGLLKSGA